MRIVLDSSVLLAALARPGVCTQLLDEIQAGHSLICSQFILDEVSRKLSEKFFLPATIVSTCIARLSSMCTMVHVVPVPADSCRDPNDLPILGTVVAGKADLLITVDKDLLALKEFRGTPIVRPADFWKRTRIV